jgi:hypothetical protein
LGRHEAIPKNTGRSATALPSQALAVNANGTAENADQQMVVRAPRRFSPNNGRTSERVKQRTPTASGSQ